MIGQIYDVIDVFQIEVSMFPQILLTIGQIVKKWQQFFAIFKITLPSFRNRSAPNFVSL